MTPEERAKDWFTIAPKFRTKEHLAAEFRDVRNDVLERVAERFHANQKLADEIRAMKHDPVLS
jgi:hypothetical protein